MRKWRSLIWVLASALLVAFVSALVFLRSRPQPPQPDRSSEVYETFAHARSIRAVNTTSKGWSVEPSPAVDLTPYRDQLLPFFRCELVELYPRDDDKVATLSIENDRGDVTVVTVVCKGKGPMLLEYQGAIYQRLGEYLPIKGQGTNGIYTSESLELTYLVSSCAADQKESARAALDAMKLSAGIKSTAP